MASKNKLIARFTKWSKLKRLDRELAELYWDREFFGTPKADIWFKEVQELKKEIVNAKQK